jgi:type II secretory pathway pseudopilin PulG
MTDGFANDPEFNDAIPKPRSGCGRRVARAAAVLAILLVLIALCLPGASRTSRGAARRVQCMNNLKQIALALRNYEDIYKALPPAHTVDANGRPLHSWRTLILPYLEQESLYKTIDLSKPWNDPANAKALETKLPVFYCPVIEPRNTTTYLGIVGPNSCFLPTKSRSLAEITDRHDSTLMVIEAGEENAIPWMAPVDADEAIVLGIGSKTKVHHPGGMNACFVAGNASFLRTSLADKIRRALMSIAGKDDKSVFDQY